MITEEDLDVVGISETWLSDRISDNEISIQGYTLFRKDRNSTNKSKGGGVALYVKIICNRSLDQS